MKATRLFIFCLIPFINSYGQNDQFANPKPFTSLFQNLRTGHFWGTANGLLKIKDSQHKDLLLDFQGSPCNLTIEEDSEEVYDVSTKIYEAKTTSGKTKINYATYNMANSFGIELNGIIYEKCYIDGGSYLTIEGVEYEYVQEKTVEFLILRFSKPVELTNIYHLLQQKDYSKELEKFKAKITVQPESVLVFAIKR